jgi:sugar phosphate isomerase/epimerase
MAATIARNEGTRRGGRPTRFTDAVPHDYTAPTMTTPFAVTRRVFLTSATFASAAALLPSAVRGNALSGTRAGASDQGDDKSIPKLGLDNFSVRSMGWKASQLIDYAASIGSDALFITDLDAFESFDAPYLTKVREQAAAKGVQLHVGTWSIDPTSKAFKPKWGTAEEHLALAISVAKGVGSPVIRAVLGTAEDRLSDGGIEKHIEETAKVCRACKSRAQDAHVKIAIENHAGDMHSSELLHLLDLAGHDFVGVNLDSGNACWTLEDPIESLEALGPYTITTSLRDSAIWKTDKGARVQWTAMGDGDIDWKAYFARFRELCPGIPVHIETISGNSREFAYLTPEFWKPWPKMPARSFARFVALAERGKPRQPWSPPAGEERAKAEQAYQRAEIEKSIAYCHNTLGLGHRTPPAPSR